MDTLLAAERALARTDQKAFEGWMIGKAEFDLKAAYQAETSEMPAVSFLKKSPMLACLKAESSELALTMWIVRPRGAGSRSGSVEAEKHGAGAGKGDMGSAEAEKHGAGAGKGGTESAENPGSAADAGTLLSEFSVSRQEIDRYQMLSEDSNPIHCGSHAIVPGFLLCNRVLPLVLEQAKLPLRWLVRFHVPVYEGEPLQLYEIADGSWAIRADGVQAVSMTQKTEEY